VFHVKIESTMLILIKKIFLKFKINVLIIKINFCQFKWVDLYSFEFFLVFIHVRIIM
jgi:hypothetical protein